MNFNFQDEGANHELTHNLEHGQYWRAQPYLKAITLIGKGPAFMEVGMSTK